MLRYPLASAFVILCVLLSNGCNSSPQQVGLAGQREKQDIRLNAIRATNDEIAGYFAGQIEEAADKIAREADSRTVRMAALQWKMIGTTAVYSATFQDDPLEVRIDLWILCAQMFEYFTTGAGQDLFGEQQSIAIEASEKIEETIINLVKMPMSEAEFEKAQETVKSWVERFPITGPLFVRVSSQPHWASISDAPASGALASVVGLEQGVYDIADRLGLIFEQLPKQARWQAEFLLLEAANEAEVETLLGNVDSLSQTANELGEVVGEVPTLVDEQREAVSATLTEQVTVITDTVSKEREMALAALTAERETIITALKDEREAILAGLDDLISNAVANSTAAADNTIERAIDRSFSRSLLFLLIAAGLGVVLIVLAWLLRRKKG